MEHSCKKTAAALGWSLAGLILCCLAGATLLWSALYLALPALPNGLGLLLSLAGYGLIALGCARSYRRSGAGRFAVAAICAGAALLVLFCNSLLLAAAPVSLRNALGLFTALCFCGALWYLAGAVASVLRAAGRPDRGAGPVRALAVLAFAWTAVEFVQITLGTAADSNLLFKVCRTFHNIDSLAAAVYLLWALYQLRSVHAVDPAKIEEMRKRLQ